MLTLTQQVSGVADEMYAGSRWLTPSRFALLAALLGVLGLSTIWPTLLTFWHSWTTDGLESLGMAVPVVSVILVARVWRSLAWRADPHWLGFVILAVTAFAVRVGEQAVVRLNVTPNYAILLPPPQLVLIAYGAGFVLLFGGQTLLRSALFPVLLLWFASPVPHHFNSLVDLPLQQASAHLVRSFAVALGQPLPPDQLRLMFTPEFGMFIAPGCDGIRGASTMGLVSLITGYLYRFRTRTTLLFVAGAVALGYLFNLLRLCALVLYYLLALHVAPLQNRAETADYILGAVLFLAATLLMFAAIQRYRERHPVAARTIPSRPPSVAPSARYACLLAMSAVITFGITGLASARALNKLSSAETSAANTRRFPDRLGRYKLQRVWKETDLTGVLIYSWAEYRPEDGSVPVALGIAPASAWHDPVECHVARGEEPAWRGPLALVGADSLMVDFSSALYTKGRGSMLEASTFCSGLSCGETIKLPTHFGITYSHPDPASLLTRNAQTVPILLLVSTDGGEGSIELQRGYLTASLRDFVALTNLGVLSFPYGR